MRPRAPPKAPAFAPHSFSCGNIFAFLPKKSYLCNKSQRNIHPYYTSSHGLRTQELRYFRTFGLRLPHRRRCRRRHPPALRRIHHRGCAVRQKPHRCRAMASGGHHPRSRHRPRGRAGAETPYRPFQPGAHRHGGRTRQLLPQDIFGSAGRPRRHHQHRKPRLGAGQAFHPGTENIPHEGRGRTFRRHGRTPCALCRQTCRSRGAARRPHRRNRHSA